MKNKSDLINYFRTKKWVIFIISILLITDLTIFLNIPFLRQILGFLFLTLLPGLLIVQILKLNKIEFTEKFILSWGLSLSFLMFFGLLINNLSLALKYETPLAIIPLLISFNIAFVVLAILGFKTNKEPIFSLPNLNLTTSEKAFLIIPVIFPALSIFGMHIMNVTDNNIVLMFMLFLIPTYVVFVCLFNQKFPKRFYPVVIFLISISLLLMLSLRSNHIIGVDTHVEYYFFQTTLNNLHWSIFGHSTLDACLAISLLPTIYQSILNISPEFLYKILCSLLYSISPIVIYILSKKYIGESYAFLASCFFMFQLNFLMNALHARTNIAILFFALAMMMLFNDRIDPLKKRLLFIIFMTSCMVSHYSTTYIFFFIMLVTFLGIEILSKKYTFKKALSLTSVLLFFSLIFFWYSQVIETAFNQGLYFFKATLSSLNNLFILESRSECAQSMFGEDILQKGIPQEIQFIFTWLTFVLTGIGVVTLIRRYKEMSFSELKFKKPDFLKEKFEVGYFVIALACAGLLVAVVALPHITLHYSLERPYSLGIVVLSIFFVIGGITLSKNLSFIKKALLKKKKGGGNALQNPVRKSVDGKDASQVRAYLVILLVLIPYFFCTVGVTHQVLGSPYVVVLNSEGAQYDMMYVHDQESYSAKWLSHSQQNLKIYADYHGHLVLISQSGISGSFIDSHSIIKHKERLYNGYIYMGYYNIAAEKFLPAYGEPHNMTEYSDIFIRKSKIYDNGGSHVWR